MINARLWVKCLDKRTSMHNATNCVQPIDRKEQAAYQRSYQKLYGQKRNKVGPNSCGIRWKCYSHRKFILSFGGRRRARVFKVGLRITIIEGFYQIARWRALFQGRVCISDHSLDHCVEHKARRKSRALVKESD